MNVTCKPFDNVLHRSPCSRLVGKIVDEAERALLLVAPLFQTALVEPTKNVAERLASFHSIEVLSSAKENEELHSPHHQEEARV